jgi:hypothetical protein
MSGATKDYADREKKLGPGKVRDSVEYSDDTNVIGEGERGLWDNIHAKRERIKNGSGEHMRKPGSKGAPTAKALRVSAEAVNPAQQAAIAISMKKAGKKPKNEDVEIDEGIMDFMSNTPAKPKSKLSLSAMRDISRKMDTKNKMPKVSRASNDSENPNSGFRLVRAEEKDEREYGYEGDMALNQLKTLVRCAEMIEDCLKPDTDLPEWVQSKITLATDYIQTAADYLYSESEMNEAKKMKGEDPCWDDYKMIGTKNKGGKQVPNCVPEEVEHTDESRQVYYINSIKNKDPAVAQAKRIKNKMAKPRMLNSPRTTLKMGESYSARNRLVMALDKEKKKREEQDAARAAREAAAQAKTPPPEKEIKEGIARLISKNIKRVTATKPTPQQKADIRLNK